MASRGPGKGRGGAIAIIALAALLSARLGAEVPGELPGPSAPVSTPAPQAPPKADDRTPARREAERRRDLKALTSRLAGLKARLAATARREADVRSDLERATLELDVKETQRRLLETRREGLEEAVGKAARERDEAQVAVVSLRAALARRFAALYRLGRLGYLRTLAAAESGLDLLRGVQTMTFFAREDARLLERYQRSIRTYRGTEAALEGQRRELSRLLSESKRNEDEVARAKQEQERLLLEIKREREVEEQSVQALEEKSKRLQALLDLLESRGKPLAPGARSIRAFKGALDWPAKGPIAVPFGRLANPAFPGTYLKSTGWVIGAPPATVVQAVFAGEVVFSQWMKGYGNLVVLDHKDGVFTLYGRLSVSGLKRGDEVALGDRLGTLDVPSDGEPPGVYFEIRDHRTSVDPAGWLR